MTVRLFHVRQAEADGPSAAPRDPKARAEMAEFLDASLTRPLFGTNEQRQAQITAAIEQMTLPQRVFAELEMRRHESHSSDYDPLRI
jgi:hypothetical protein